MIILNQLRSTQSHLASLIETKEFLYAANWYKQPLAELEAEKTKQRILLQSSTQGLQSPKYFTNVPVLIKFDRSSTDNIVVVSIKTTQMAWTIPSSPQICNFQDNEVRANVTTVATVSVQDSKKLWPLWDAGKDPLDLLKTVVEKKLAEYFKTTTFEELIEYDDLFLENQLLLLKRVTNRTVAGLEALLAVIKIDGLDLPHFEFEIKFETVPNAAVQPTPPIEQIIEEKVHELRTRNNIGKESLKKMQDAEAALRNRQRIEALLDKDMYYAPHNLRGVIMQFDPLLLDRFYYDTWDDAMNELKAKVNQAKADWQQWVNLKKWKNLLDGEQSSGTQEKELFLPKYNAYMNSIFTSGLYLKLPTYDEFFRSFDGNGQAQPKQLTTTDPNTVL